MSRPRTPAGPFRYFNSSREVIRLVVLMYVRFPLSLRKVEDLLFERGIDICHETVSLPSLPQGYRSDRCASDLQHPGSASLHLRPAMAAEVTMH